LNIEHYKWLSISLVYFEIYRIKYCKSCNSWSNETILVIFSRTVELKTHSTINPEILIKICWLSRNCILSSWIFFEPPSAFIGLQQKCCILVFTPKLCTMHTLVCCMLIVLKLRLILNKGRGNSVIVGRLVIPVRACERSGKRSRAGRKVRWAVSGSRKKTIGAARGAGKKRWAGWICRSWPLKPVVSCSVCTYRPWSVVCIGRWLISD